MHGTEPDSCPGVLRLHQAADGPLARVRLPGGQLTPAQLRTLAGAAAELAGGCIELTSRGNIQLRRVGDADELARRLAAAGLLPSAAHERVRNIVASPLTGRIGGLADLRPLVATLDAGLCADPALAELPGRVLFTVDDGRGDVSGLRGDIGLHAVNPDEFTLMLAGADTGVRFTGEDAVPGALAAARAFVELRGEQWRLAELEQGSARVLRRLGRAPTHPPLACGSAATAPIGWLPQDDGRVALGAGVRLGSLDARLAEFLAAPNCAVVVTPWRGVVLCDVDESVAEQVVRVLAPQGLIFDVDSPWLQVSACAGKPGCPRSHTDVRADLAAAIETGTLPVTGRQHWAGCARRCGHPAAAAEVVAEAGGHYRVNDTARNPVSDEAND